MKQHKQIQQKNKQFDDGYKNFGRATHCSIGFFILSISANTVQNAEAQAMDSNGFSKLGFFSLSLLYFFLGAGSLVSTAVMNKVGVKYCLAIGAVFDCFWILSSIFPYLQKQNPGDPRFIYSNAFIYLTTILSSIFDGLGNAIQWVAQGKYIADCATEKTKGFFFSYFWAYYMASQIVGNLLGALVIKQFDQIVFYLTMACFSILASFIFICLKDPITSYEALEDDQIQQNVLQRQPNYNTMDPPPFQMEDQQLGLLAENNLEGFQLVKKEVKSTIKMLVSERMRVLIPYIMWSGVSLSIYTGLLVEIIAGTIQSDSEDQQMMKSLFAMVSLGIGEIVGGFYVGQIIDKFGSKTASISNIALVGMQTIVVLAFIYNNKFSLMVFVMTFIWGFADSGVNTHLTEILGFEFENNSEPYSVFNLVQSFTVFLFMIIMAFVKSRFEFYAFISITGTLGILICYYSLKFDYKNEKLDVLRKSVIIETSFTQRGSQSIRQQENQKIIGDQDRQIVINFDISSGSPNKSNKTNNTNLSNHQNISALTIEFDKSPNRELFQNENHIQEKDDHFAIEDLDSNNTFKQA
ncbi:major facilitator superfamily protein [Stylonychia lemnae]|uniref:UNC93-like protein MFSD11 n=1 Tax=Stylonychia lemnae TaxID=5949 RepID=A0A078AME2_STYLE|nr:major facilitator superfamily protein [Stylonychia lemnae]|eukprot:CDW83344.1 major facilitator superfamily protein [Stylonychia lemnae]